MADKIVKRRIGLMMNVRKEITKLRTSLDGNVSENRVLIQTSIAKLTEYRSRLQDHHEKILEVLTEDAQLDKEIADATVVDDDILELVERGKANVDAVDRQEHLQAQTSRNDSADHASANTVKLPKFDLPTFDGDPLQWQEFWDCFQCTIDAKDNLSGVTKLKYLKTCLAGCALRLVEGYRLTEANYKEVVSALQERFGNPQLAIFSHLSAMLEIAPATHDLSQLQAVYDDCERHIRSLVALGLAEDTFGQVFTPMILSKLPTYVKMELHRKNGDQAWTLSNLRSLLKEEIRVRDMSERQFGPGQQQNRKEKQNPAKAKEQPHRSNGGNRSSASTLSAGQSKRAPKGACPFCGSAHAPESCQKYPSPRARKSRLQGRCYACLEEGHGVTECKEGLTCRICGKPGHHPSLCFAAGKRDNSQGGAGGTAQAANPTSMNPKATSFTPVNAHAFGGIPRRDAHMQTAVATVFNVDNSRSVSARLMFDTAGFRSYVTSTLAKEIGAHVVDKDPVGLAVFEAQRRKNTEYDVVEIDVKTNAGDMQRVIADVSKLISLPILSQPVDFKSYPSLKTLQLAEPTVGPQQMLPIDVLIGADYYYDFVTNELVRFGNGLVLVGSSLGYLVGGGVVHHSQGSTTLGSNMLSAQASADSNYDLERFWKLESVGITDPPDSADDERALAKFSASVEFHDGRYFVTWPWKFEHPELPDNYGLALGRLRSLMRQLNKQPEVLQKYNGVIVEQMSLGIIEIAPQVPTGPLVHYIPHHCVVKPDRATTKIRVVYDASAKTRASGLSLNDCIFRGPVLLNDLTGILLRFRMFNVALIADIEKAFLQIMLQDTERDVTRFLWLRDVSKPVSISNLVVYRFQRVLFGNVASPFLLGATMRHHLRQYDEPTASTLLRDSYIDNVVTGTDDVEAATVFYDRSKSMFKDMSMNLREWFSSSQGFLDKVPEKDKGRPSPRLKVLGVRWEPTGDRISCDAGFVDSLQPSTKREILQAAAKLFDPLGLYTPVTISVKVLLQEAWKKQYAWDDVLPQDVLRQYGNFHSSLKEMQSHSVPRLVVGIADKKSYSFQLHCFVDASAKGYAAAMYLRRQAPDETFAMVGLLMAKGRVSPVKQLTIPKLELMAVLIGARLVDFVRNELSVEFESVFLWSDSQCVLHWVAGTRVQTPFVQNRLNQIAGIKGITYRYVPTRDNPADIASRGSSFQELMDYGRWWQGPQWLPKDESSWPQLRGCVVSASPAEEEPVVPGLIMTVPPVDDAVDFFRYSTATRLHRAAAWCLRFAANCRKERGQRQDGPLTAAEVQSAQRRILLNVQAGHFGTLFAEGMSAKDKLLVRQLQLFEGDDGLIRTKGRLQNSNLSEPECCPLVVPKDHPYTRLLILDAHERVMHAGVPHTLAKLRQTTWVIHGRAQVKRVLRSCRVCRVLKAKPFHPPDAPPLPGFRVSGSTAFEVVGLDYLGPLLINVKGAEEKVWVCLFTCASVRAIHLEVVSNMTAEQFLLALRRFGALYDYPRLIVSDNARTFTAARNCLEKVWRSDKVQEFAGAKGISWKFITERAPWMGGFYERLVGLTKNALRSSLRLRKVDIVEMMTVCYEIASTLNTRPLLYVESDDPTTLCPGNFLLKGSRNQQSQGDREGDDEDFQPDVLVSKWRRIQAILDAFWRLWSKHYLLSLREHFVHKKVRGCSDMQPQVGMSVIVQSEAPRGQWKIGRIEELKVSSDGKVRSAKVRVPNGLISRPITMLCPLEAALDKGALPTRPTTPADQSSGTQQTTRTAATAARNAIRQQLADGSDDE